MRVSQDLGLVSIKFETIMNNCAKANGQHDLFLYHMCVEGFKFREHQIRNQREQLCLMVVSKVKRMD
jgi:hypothetical protein